ncbi:hypothetical protein AYO44_03805 [Planctomycetaceae bacterium SCGC AG-212-F19]|nr:hypothetical protein AYO44_03805 [Planctomycetaceae bacterium SCGC AG-212-F19]
MDDRTLTAYHEAGHAIAAVGMGVKVLRIHIHQRGRSAGRCEHAPCSTDAEGVILCGGPAAEFQVSGRWNWLTADGSDWKRLDALTASMSYRQTCQWRDQRLQEARQLVADNWGAVEWLAGELLRRGEVDGAEIEQNLLRR